MIVMTLSDPDGSVDREREMIVVISNATDDLQLFAAPSVAGIDFTLHTAGVVRPVSAHIVLGQ